MPPNGRFAPEKAWATDKHVHETDKTASLALGMVMPIGFWLSLRLRRGYGDRAL